MVPVDEFVEKPVDPAALVAKVDGLLAAGRERDASDRLRDSCART